MTIDKITSPISELELINKTNEIIDYKQDKLTPGDGITIEQEEGGWTPATSELGEYQWQALGYGDGKFVAMTYSSSDGYYSAVSTDGSTWTRTDQEGDDNLKDVVYDGTKFVALGNRAVISTSTDGIAWNSIYVDNLGYDNSWQALAYNGTKFVALGSGGYVSTSIDGTTWTTATQNSNLGSHSWLALAYGNNKFVALGYNGYTSISADGTTWTTATQNSNLGSQSWRALAYNGTKFVAVGADGYISTSTYGTTWTTAVQDSNLGSKGWEALAYDGTKLVALSSDGYISQFVGGGDLIISSYSTWGSITGTLADQTDLQDALNGKQATLVSGTNIKTINSNSLLGSGNVSVQPTLVSGTNIKTINNNSLLGSGNISIDSLPAQTGQSGKFLTTNGSSASWSTLPSSGTWGSITGILSNQTDLQDALDKKQDKLTPGDGITIEQEEGGWTPATYISEFEGGGWQALGYGDGKFVAMTYSSSEGYSCAVSTDGSTWTVTQQEGDNNLKDIAYDGTKFVALGNSGTISTSTDGTNWVATYVSNLGPHDWQALAYDGTKFVALGWYGYISTSTDGTTWTTAAYISNLGSHDWQALAYSGTKFVALGNSGTISTSTDGTTWTAATQVANLGSRNWQALDYNGNEFVALDYSGYTSTSTDGTTWTAATQGVNPGSHDWHAMTNDGTKLVAVGNSGYTSQYLLGDLVISATYTLPIASTTQLGGIKVGNNLSIDSSGILSADAQPITIDSALSTTSENPVQNKVITGAIEEKASVTFIDWTV